MSFLIDKIATKVMQRNQNFMGIFCGATGDGKSYSAIKFGEELSKITGAEFAIKHVAFSPHEFMELINSDLPRGSVIIFDEVGTGLDAKKWYTAINILISYTLQTFRRYNLIVLFTTPDFGFIDSSARRLLHAYFENVKIDYRRKECIVKPYLCQNNPRYSKMYFKYPRVIIDERLRVIRRMRIGLPSDDMLKDYEEKKKEFTDRLNRKVMDGIAGFSVIDSKKLSPVEQSCIKLNKEGLTQVQIAGLLNVKQTSVSSALKRAKNKGYTVKLHWGKQAKKLSDITTTHTRSP